MSLPAVSEHDLELIDAGMEMGVDIVALSFIRRREDIDPVRERLGSAGRDVPVIAKIEKPQAAINAEEIVDAADGIMVARGDLGIELPIEDVPLVQKKLLHIAGQRAKPSITATQMLESMVHSSRPTRAEVADVSNAIFDGTDAVMLSQETAIGRDPTAAVHMMSQIAKATERELPYWRMLTERGLRGGNDSATIAFGAVGAVYQLGLKALVVPTMTGTHRPVHLVTQARGAHAGAVAAARRGAPLLALLGRPRAAARRAAAHHRPARRLRRRRPRTPASARRATRSASRRACPPGRAAARTCSRCRRWSRRYSASSTLRHGSNTPSARSRCSRSCVAIRLVRSSAPPRSTAG